MKGEWTMRRWMLAMMLTLALLPATARAERVSLPELQEQARAMGGRWTAAFDTPNGALAIDIPVIVPRAERCPVITVENAPPLDEALLARMEPLRGEYAELDVNGVPCDIALTRIYEGYTTDSAEAKGVALGAGIWRLTADAYPNAGAKPDSCHYPWDEALDGPIVRGSDQTVAEAMAVWQGLIDALYPDQGFVIQPKQITARGSTLARAIPTNEYPEKYLTRDGAYEIRAEQLIGGIPMIGAISSMMGDNDFRLPHGATADANRTMERLAPYRVGAFWNTSTDLWMTSSGDADFMARISLDRVRSVELSDVALAPLSGVLAGITGEIEAGHIRAAYALRLGYLRYSNPEMTDYAWAVPVWVLDCDYVTRENQAFVDSMRAEFSAITRWDAYEFTQMPIDARTGEPILFTDGDEATFSVPDIASWAEN